MNYDELVERLNIVREGMEAGVTDWPTASQIWEYQKAADAITTLQAELEQCRKDAEWQPIETAPKDGTRILVKGDCTVVAGWQFINSADCHGWAIVNDAWMPECISTHWKPLPKPPVTDAAIDKAMESV